VWRDQARDCRCAEFCYIAAAFREGYPQMAEHAAVEFATATGNDYAQHERSYHGFLKLTKYCTVAVVILLIFLTVVFV
jgi:hypothetical protein